MLHNLLVQKSGSKLFPFTSDLYRVSVGTNHQEMSGADNNEGVINLTDVPDKYIAPLTQWPVQ